MEKKDIPTKNRVADTSMRQLDRRISALEIQGADIGAALVKARFKLFKTYTAEDMRLLDQVAVGNDTLIPG